jgi:hypothetical protein
VLRHAPDTLVFSSLYPASTRLVVAVVVFAAFVVLLPRRTRRPLPNAALGVIAAGWLFGATLIWGTPWASKLRWASGLNTWQNTALLAVAVVGVLCAAAALRGFAEQRPTQGWVLTGLFAVAFAGWSSVVRYSIIVAGLVLSVGIGALVFASSTPAGPEATHAEPNSASSHASARLRSWRIAGVALPVVSGVGFYWWLELSPKSAIDPKCGLSGWILLTVIPFLAIPGGTAWMRTRTLGKSREAATAATVASVAVTIGVGILAFLVWFGANQCGE